MNNVTTENVYEFLVSYINESVKLQGRSIEKEITKEFDMFLEGAVDSIGILDLTLKVQEHYNVEIDFEDLDPEEMTIVGSFCQYIVTKINNM